MMRLPSRLLFHHRASLAISAALNLVLFLYILPRREHLWDIRDYRYVQVGKVWFFMAIGLPTFILLLSLSVLRSNQKSDRWLAIALGLFPAYLAVAGWVQLISL